MRVPAENRFFMAVFFCLVGSLVYVGAAWAEKGKWTSGFRAGFSVLTQEATANSDSSIGPMINLQGLYGVSDEVLAGLMVEWERHSLDRERPEVDFGSFNTVSIMPTVEWHPGSYGGVMPYTSAAIGVNINTFSEDDALGNTEVSLSDNFAFRLAGGVDIPLSSKLAFNVELAWKRNRGSIDIGAAEGTFDASSFGFLFGARYTY